MDRTELAEKYEDGWLESPARLMNLRPEIKEFTGLEVPSRREDVVDWWDDHKSVFSQKISSDSDEEDETQSDNE